MGKKRQKTKIIPNVRRILAFDPGVQNFAYSLLEDGVPIKTGWVRAQNNVDNDGNFINNISEMLREYKPDIVIAERYMFRGMQSVHTELISIMLGKLSILTRIILGTDLILITASSWKNKFKLKKLKRGAFDLFPNIKFEAIHEADASGIGLYIYKKLLGIK